MRELEGKWQFAVASREDSGIERERDEPGDTEISSPIMLAMGIIYGHRVALDFEIAARVIRNMKEIERAGRKDSRVLRSQIAASLTETSCQIVFSPL
jgi:hypothetical protein